MQREEPPATVWSGWFGGFVVIASGAAAIWFCVVVLAVLRQVYQIPLCRHDVAHAALSLLLNGALWGLPIALAAWGLSRSFAYERWSLRRRVVLAGLIALFALSAVDAWAFLERYRCAFLL